MQNDITSEAIAKLYEADADPVIGVTGRTVRFLNLAARRLYGELPPVCALRTLLPEHVAMHQASAFFATARVNGQLFVVTVSSVPGLRIFRLTPKRTQAVFPDILAPSDLFSMELGMESAFFLEHAEKTGDLSVRHYAARLLQTSDQLRRWIGNVTTLRDLHCKAYHPPEHALDIALILTSMMEYAQARLAERDIRLTYTVPDSACRVRITPTHLEQIVLNLLSNAIKSCEKGSTISVNLMRSTRTVKLSVQDSGQGSAEGVLTEIFHAYSENTLPRPERPHTGYGLPVCFSVADAVGGSLLIESNRRGGATVHVVLPLYTSHKTSLYAPEDPNAQTYRTELWRIGLSDAFADFDEA